MTAVPPTLIHPGQILADELEELDISAAELPRQLRVPLNRISRIIRGKRMISADTALRLGRRFGTGALFWLNLQQTYDLDLAEREAGKEIEKIEQRNAV